MINKQDRQNLIIKILRSDGSLQISDIIKALKTTVDPRTILRDIKDLISQKLVNKKGVGKGTFYSISYHSTIFENIDIEQYFAKEYEKREIYTTFNFDIFDILQDDVFSSEEQQKLTKLHDTFMQHIATYDSQTLINKEYERIMIEFSWKSSAIE